MSATRLLLKQPTGWFAAGREVADALELLSDGAFKLYMHLCLEADRHTGRVRIDSTALTRVLRKDVASIETGLDELQHHGVCERKADQVEICDRFWPYQKQVMLAAGSPEVAFLRQAQVAFLAPACVRSTFTAADEKLARNLGRSGVTLEQLHRAIWLGCARKYVALLNGRSQRSITSLAYFASLIEEVSQPQIPSSYWEHVRRRMEELEKRWVQAANSVAATNAGSTEASSPEML
jgi:hypothetical protein